jgi:hypothetical protein
LVSFLSCFFSCFLFLLLLFLLLLFLPSLLQIFLPSSIHLSTYPSFHLSSPPHSPSLLSIPQDYGTNFTQSHPANYLPLITHLRTLLTRAQKKFYTISVGKINPAKLANFPEIECYVLVACAENSIVESKVGWLSFLHTWFGRRGAGAGERS